MLHLLIFIFAVISKCNGRPDGAPTSACSSLTPVHSGIEPQRSSSPYSVSAVRNGNKVRVTISSPIGEEIEGFILQARFNNDKNRMAEGTFTERSGNSRAIDCFRGKKNTLTQVNPSQKTEIVTDWMPTESLQGDIIFRATIAKTFALFWTEVDSPPVRMRSDSSNADQPQRKGLDSHSMYYDCFVTKGCFGYPSGCIPRTDCEVLLSYVNGENGISFTMTGNIERQNYMAMGISLDPQMGDDAVTECFRDGSTITARESWNDGRSNSLIKELPRNSYDGFFSDGLTSCSWTEKYLKESNGRRFNLANSTYYLLLAKGSMRNDRIGYHSGRLASQDSVNFTAFDAIAGEGVSDSIKIHGTFMVTAWIGFVSIAIILARHFKSAWDTSKFCGVKIWFALHRGMMISALLLVIIAFIVIFVHKDGWNYETKNPHAVLGCIAVALGLFQPIMAAFRPGPDHDKRPIFNWLHWFVGNLAHLLSVITMFFAVSLESSGLKESFYWVLAIFVILHLLFHFLFQMLAWTSGKKKNEVKMVEMNSRGNAQNGGHTQEKNIGDNAFRVLLLGIYVIFIIVVLLALYALIGVA